MHCWADLQSVHELRCYDDNIARTRNVSECLYALMCLFYLFIIALQLVNEHATFMIQHVGGGDGGAPTSLLVVCGGGVRISSGVKSFGSVSS